MMESDNLQKDTAPDWVRRMIEWLPDVLRYVLWGKREPRLSMDWAVWRAKRLKRELAERLFVLT